MRIVVLAFCLIWSGYIAYGQTNGDKKIQIERTIKKTPLQDSLKSLLITAKDTARVILLNKLSYQYHLQSLHERALSFAQEACNLSQQLNYKKGLAKGKVNSGNVFLSLSNYEEAKQFYMQGLDLAKEIKNELIISHCVNNLGEIERSQGNFLKAINYYLEALRIDEKGGNIEEIAPSLNNIGLTYREMKETTKAIDYFNRSLKLSEEANNKYYIAVNLSNLADLYYNQHNDAKALNYFQRSLQINTEIKRPVGITSCMIGIGNVCLALEKLDSASEYYSRALILSKSIDNKRGVIYCLNNLGIIKARKGLFAKAVEFHLAFLRGAKEINSKRDVCDAYLNLSEDYRETKDYKNALDFRLRYEQLNDTLFNAEKGKQIAEVENKYKVEKAQHEIESLIKEQSLQAKVNRNQKIIFSGIALLFMMGGLVYYFRAQAKAQENTRLTEKVDAQNRELSTVALLVSKKNQSLSNLKSKLTDLLKKPLEDVAPALKSAVKEIDSEINFDDEWDTFKYHFEKVHPGFFSKLKEAGPSLNDRELRFCAYLKSNLSTKEIARLTGTTVRSVQQNKYRINQKLSASTESNLSDFLQSL